MLYEIIYIFVGALKFVNYFKIFYLIAGAFKF